MRLLNVGCGAVRPGDPWTNLDNLHEVLAPGTPERRNLDLESNYVNHVIGYDLLPFVDETFDGILLSHVVEHFDCQDSVELLLDCKRVLKPGGDLVVSVPDAEFFLRWHADDTRETAEEIFGEPICPDEPWHTSFFNYALFYNQHKQVLTDASLRCLLLRAGFTQIERITGAFRHDAARQIIPIMNRRKFSLELIGVK